MYALNVTGNIKDRPKRKKKTQKTKTKKPMIHCSFEQFNNTFFF
jgi:hypothetical protein